MKNKTHAYIISIALLLFTYGVRGQEYALFDNPELLELVKKGGHLIYNIKPEEANKVIIEVKERLPNHPIGHLMEALNIAWQEMPIRTTSSVFPKHRAALDKVIETALALREENSDHQEGIFFELSARGLLAEYYAKEGSYLKALGESRKMYSLMKKCFEYAEENVEFAFQIGLYNYFREMYPQRHPIYKPFMWVFRSGSIEKGLAQMNDAAKNGNLTKIEAHLYLSYIYIRYENDPDKAEGYLNNLVNEYPNNPYFKTKLIECLVLKEEYESALPSIDTLQTKADPYYKMCGEIFYGVYLEKHKKDLNQARNYYEQGLNTGEYYLDKGFYYRSVAYLGLGRIADRNNEFGKAEEYYHMAISIDENDLVTTEAKQRLKNLK